MKKLESVSYKNVKLTGGFWKKWQETVALNTVNAVSEKSKVTVNADSAKFKCLSEETLK